MKIKAIPIKSETLCEKCIYNGEKCVRNIYACMYCDMFRGDCMCLGIKNGEPCHHFKRKINYLL